MLKISKTEEGGTSVLITKPDGTDIERLYNSNGSLQMEEKINMKTGEAQSKAYDKNGNIYYESESKNGISTEKRYDDKGKIYNQTIYNAKNGRSINTEYHKDGSKTKSYDDGKGNNITKNYKQ